MFSIKWGESASRLVYPTPSHSLSRTLTQTPLTRFSYGLIRSPFIRLSHSLGRCLTSPTTHLLIYSCTRSFLHPRKVFHSLLQALMHSVTPPGTHALSEDTEELSHSQQLSISLALPQSPRHKHVSPSRVLTETPFHSCIRSVTHSGMTSLAHPLKQCQTQSCGLDRPLSPRTIPLPLTFPLTHSFILINSLAP